MFYRLFDPNVARGLLRLPGVALKQNGSLHTSFIGMFVQCTQKQAVRVRGKRDDAPSAELYLFSFQPANCICSRYDAVDM